MTKIFSRRESARCCAMPNLTVLTSEALRGPPRLSLGAPRLKCRIGFRLAQDIVPPSAEIPCYFMILQAVLDWSTGPSLIRQSSDSIRQTALEQWSSKVSYSLTTCPDFWRASVRYSSVSPRDHSVLFPWIFFPFSIQWRPWRNMQQLPSSAKLFNENTGETCSSATSGEASEFGKLFELPPILILHRFPISTDFSGTFGGYCLSSFCN